MSGIQH
jgi:hypothetical protein